jgi:hypothetical protein
MASAIFTVIGSFATHYIPFIGPFLGGGFDTVAALLQVVGHSLIG